jgi:hypothetical protein
MTNTITIRVKRHAGDVLLPAEAMALLLGVPAVVTATDAYQRASDAVGRNRSIQHL